MKEGRGNGGQVPVITYILIGLCVAVYAAVLLLPGGGALTDAMALYPTDVTVGGRPWALLTSMFAHADLAHLGANMWSLWMLGPACESMLGRARYAAVYLVGGLVGGVTFALVHLAMGDASPAVGASGAIFSLMGAYGAVLVLLRKMQGWAAEGDVGAAWREYVSVLALNLVVVPMVGNIAWEAHLGGLVAGFAMGLAMMAPRLRVR